MAAHRSVSLPWPPPPSDGMISHTSCRATATTPQAGTFSTVNSPPQQSANSPATSRTTSGSTIKKVRGRTLPQSAVLCASLAERTGPVPVPKAVPLAAPSGQWNQRQDWGDVWDALPHGVLLGSRLRQRRPLTLEGLCDLPCGLLGCEVCGVDDLGFVVQPGAGCLGVGLEIVMGITKVPPT